MKRLLIGFLLAALLVSCSFPIYAAQGKFYGRHEKQKFVPDYHLRDDARYVIHRTAQLVMDAQRAVEHRHRSRGLAQAIAHQQKARELYFAGAYQDAIFHSLRARDLAIEIIRANRERPRREFFRDDKEERYFHGSPRNEELDLRIDMRKLGKDNDVVRFHFDLDINQ